LHHANAALKSSTDDAAALAIAGFVISLLSKDHGAGLNAIDRALSINPSCATALYLAAITNAISGHSPQAREHARRALRLSPFDLLVYLAYFAQGFASIQEERYEEATKYLVQAMEANELSSLRFVAAIAHALAGSIEVARSIAERGLEMEPGFKLHLFLELVSPEIAEKLAEGGRILGLPN
jgi:tetratricopeptide (TPR) repeat protein